MPAIAAIPWLIPLITGIGAATTLGTTAYELSQGSGGGSSNSLAQAQAQLKQQQAQQTAQQKSAFLASQGNVQERTGGSLTPSGFNTETAIQAGLPSDLNSLLKYLGQGTGGGTTSSSISGGVTTPNGTTTPGGGQDLEGLSNLLKAA